MRFILLAISIFFASNTYAAVFHKLYVYPDDSNEFKVLKEKLAIQRNRLAKAYLMLFKTNRKALSDEDEVVYKVGDISKKDISAKIGMSTEQVLNDTYWGKPDSRHTDTYANDKIELWIYDMYGERNQLSSINGFLFFVNGRLTHRIY